MSKKISRAEFIVQFLGLGAVLLLPRFLGAQTPNPPRNRFNDDTTAEDVTRGMDLTGKTILVTGTNSGLGHETMRVLAMRGAHVLATGRTMQKAADAAKSVKGRVTPLVCELTDFDSVVRCAQRAHELCSSLDAVVCNAGIMGLQELETVYGLEKQFVVNYLGHFLLVQRLFPLLINAPQGRIVLLSSGLIRDAPQAGIEFDNLDGNKGYEPAAAYGQSKLAMALFAAELYRRHANDMVTANAVHPGIIHTNLLRHLPWYQRAGASSLGWAFIFNKNVEEGAATQTFVATHPSLAKVSGHFFVDCNPVTPEGPHVADRELAARLWERSMELIQPYV